MASHKTLAHRLFKISKISTQNPVPPNSAPKTFFRKFLTPQPNTDESGFFRRWLHKRAIFQSAARPEYLSLPISDKLIERLRGINGDRLRLEGLAHPQPPPLPSLAQRPRPDSGISVEDARKLLRISQLEGLKSSLKGVRKSCVSYPEFLQIVAGGCMDGSDPAHVAGLARMLDESGVVIVLGNVVFLRPEQIVKAIESSIPLSLTQTQTNDSRRKEFEKMEKEKMKIDEKAETLVRRELWCGLSLLAVQTVGFMRLTFWELSWDVMEPICFFITSIYFMAGYGFFLKTSKDPSFEGFFEARFCAKQKRLTKIKKFDVHRFNELRREFDLSDSSSSSSFYNGLRRELLGAQ